MPRTSGCPRAPTPQGAPEYRSSAGDPAALPDIPAKVDGGDAYGIDLRLPDMLYATTRRLRHGGKLVSVDPQPASCEGC